MQRVGRTQRNPALLTVVSNRAALISFRHPRVHVRRLQLAPAHGIPIQVHQGSIMKREFDERRLLLRATQLVSSHATRPFVSAIAVPSFRSY